MLATVICGMLAAIIVALVVGAVVFDLVGHLGDGLRWSMILIAAGLLWGGVDRFHRAPVSFGDVLFLAGVAGVMIFAWAAKWRAALDALDGEKDGRCRFPPIIKS